MSFRKKEAHQVNLKNKRNYGLFFRIFIFVVLVHSEMVL